jgi:hypothetical protein
MSPEPAGTALAAQALQEFQVFDSTAAAKRNITKAIEDLRRELRGRLRQMSSEEAAVLALLQQRMEQELTGSAKPRTRMQANSQRARTQPAKTHRTMRKAKSECTRSRPR